SCPCAASTSCPASPRPDAEPDPSGARAAPTARRTIRWKGRSGSTGWSWGGRANAKPVGLAGHLRTLQRTVGVRLASGDTVVGAALVGNAADAAIEARR